MRDPVMGHTRWGGGSSLQLPPALLSSTHCCCMGCAAIAACGTCIAVGHATSSSAAGVDASGCSAELQPPRKWRDRGGGRKMPQPTVSVQSATSLPATAATSAAAVGVVPAGMLSFLPPLVAPFFALGGGLKPNASRARPLIAVALSAGVCCSAACLQVGLGGATHSAGSDTTAGSGVAAPPSAARQRALRPRSAPARAEP